MSAFKVLVVVAVVLCVHTLMVEAGKGGKKKQPTSPRQRPNQQGGRPHGNGQGNGNGGGKRPHPHNGGGKRKAGPGQKRRKAAKRPRPTPVPPPGRRSGRPVQPYPRPDPEKVRQMQCSRLMMVRNTKEQLDKCEKDTPKAVGETIQDHKNEVYKCLQREHGVMKSNGEPIVESILHHIDDNEHVDDQELKDELKAQVEVCAKDISEMEGEDAARKFRDCIVNFCNGEEEEEAEEEEQKAAEE